MKRIIIAQESDPHGGNKLGLLNPDVEFTVIHQNNKVQVEKPTLTESQTELWRLRQENIGRLIDLAGKDDIHYIQAGDQTQGDKHKAELVSDRMTDQISIAVANARPIMDIKRLKSALFAAGTGAHNWGMGSADVLITDQLRQLYPKQRIEVCYHGLAHYDQFTVDFAHHGPYTGSREWLKGNVARYYLQSMMFHAVKHAQKPADLVIRGHYHTPVVETVRINGYISTIVVSPSMCMIDDFAHQAAKSPEDVTVGMMAYEIIDNVLFKVHQFTRTYDTRTEIIL